MIKTVQICTHDIIGGAARAAHRLHKGLLRNGQGSKMVVMYKLTNDRAVYYVEAENMAEEFDKEFFLSTVIQDYYINNNRTDISNTLFSLPYPGYDLTRLSIVMEADIINLHWINYYQSLVTLKRIFALGKPVVWTLHDQWAFTGGCHYTAGCEKYCDDCIGCPQLMNDQWELPAVVLSDKINFFSNIDPVIVTPSRWMAACAGKSRLFRNSRIEVIPNSLETEIFRPLPKSKAKKMLGIDGNVITILFGAEDGTEKRKGFHELMAAMAYCLENPRFQHLIQEDRVKILCFGRPSNELDALGVPTVSLGYLRSDQKVRDAYCAADVFIHSALEDNLPNTVLEAMSCGTPVVAFDVGGIPDMVVDGVNGQLVSLGDERRMGEAICSLIFDTKKRKTMGKQCREKMEETYTLKVQAERYVALYAQLMAEGGSIKENGMNRVRAIPPSSQKDHDSSRTDLLPVLVETEVGPHFAKIFDEVLFSSLKAFASKREKAYRAAMKKLKHHEEEMGYFEKALQERDKVIWEKDSIIREKDSNTREKDGIIQEKDRHIQEHYAAIVERDTIISNTYALISQKDAVIVEKNALIGEKDAVIVEKNALIVEKDAVIGEKNALIVEKDAVIGKQNAVIGEQNAVILEKDAVIGEKNALIVEKDAVIGEKDAVIGEKDAVIVEKDAVIGEQNAVISEKDALIWQNNIFIRQRENDIRNMQNSLSWKITKPLRGFKALFRRLFGFGRSSFVLSEEKSDTEAMEPEPAPNNTSHSER